ncbi:hypothetical protein EN08_008755 [Vibrio parahaemolyticus]|nr:hypothetical protein EN09_003800 [Vibrio parahaemolyticus]OQT65823.1 hypothetical protein EM93_006920 [Vibrio parahaemolyticus]OQT68013.1 hypothetical protein EM75_017635 [Vibrio parahaemolyticus]OQT70676.1 hypothetical protein EN07_015635 [Vibrio parahaemolyticus]OQT76888.1 hypothetical protein EM98_019965 [Vibrio parahaemolyticus]
MRELRYSVAHTLTGR